MFSKKRRARWTGRRDPEFKEPRLPVQGLAADDMDDPLPAGPRLSGLIVSPDLSNDRTETAPTSEPETPPPHSAETSTRENSTIPSKAPDAEAKFGRAIGKLMPLDTVRTADEPRANGSKSPYSEEITAIGEGIAALLAEEANDPAPAPAATPTFNSFLTNDPAKPRPTDDEPSKPQSRAAAVPAAHSEFRQRLITQIAEVMWFPKDMSETAREDRLIEAYDALVGIDPQDEVEGMLACQLVVTHRAALDCMRLSMASPATSGDRGDIIGQVERLLAIHTRNLAALDQHRARNKQRAVAGFGKKMKPSEDTVSMRAESDTSRDTERITG